MSTKTVIKGTLIFTIAGLFCRFAGFAFKIYISRILEPSQLGLYQMAMPIGVLLQSISVGGLTAAVSKYAAANKNPLKGFFPTLTLSLTLSVILAIIAELNADKIAIHFLNNAECTPLVTIIAYSLPFSSLHAIIAAFFTGRNKPGLTALSQIIEQVVRIGAVYVIAGIFAQNETKTDAALPIIGTLAGELAAALFSIAALCLIKNEEKTYSKGDISQLFANLKLAMPISANRLCLHLLQSLEAALIPMMLIRFGMDSEASLSEYGIITGMVMPLIFFPATITNSLSQALLPDISESWEKNNSAKIQKSISLTLKIAINLGVMCIPGFIFYGGRFGSIIFDNYLVEKYVKILCCMCPFIFLTAPLGSILNAVGKPAMVLTSGMTGGLLRMALIVFAIPRFGLLAYFTAMVASHVLICIMMLIKVKQITGCTYKFLELIAAPVIRTTICFFSTYLIFSLCVRFKLPELLSLIIAGTSFGLSCIISTISSEKLNRQY